MKRKKLIKTIFHRLAVILVLLFALFPFYMMITTAFKTSEASVAYPPQIIPQDITLKHFQDVLNPEIFPFWRYFFNSFKIAFCTALISTTVGAMGAYSLSRLTFPGSLFLRIHAHCLHVLRHFASSSAL